MQLSSTQSQTNQFIHRTVLDNGIVLLVAENPTADIIAARMFIRAGSRWDPPEQAGLSHLVSAVLSKGTEKLSSLEIAEQVESLGASLSTDATTDYFLISLKSVSADFPEMLELAADVLRSPSFPAAELELERRLTLQAIRSQQEQPFTIAFDQLRHMMYGEHPYALSGLGTEKTVAQLSQTDLQNYHRTHFRPDNLVISLSGRINPSAAIALVNQVLGDWQVPPTPLPTLATLAVQTTPLRQAVAQDTQQSIVMLGYLAPPVRDGASSTVRDYSVLKLLNTYLGNGLSSRLFVELREKRGLAYEVSAFYTTRLDPAQFVAYMGTAPENTAIALEGLQTEIDRLRVTPLTGEELQAAKNKLLGQYALGKQTNAQIAQTFGWYETLGIGIDFDTLFQKQVAETTADAVQDVAQKYLTVPYVSLVGPAGAVDKLANYP
ncbi:MAG: pitrilysin family protein [Leptolyngbyaceae cyanobacterium]|uniref:M16 family metallopeptidase n=2 Tax=Leptodesmis TaxID=2664261 RepID=UPI001F3BF5F9|nr:pitrilysin family protein [Leptodesmis sichuanensis]